uniref:Putative staufen n=1 Tax=Haematobia irritans TaxID=7368 RepID=A0A1L8ED62_HAEIR
MASKSTVSALQEYCAKHKIPPPIYECIDSSDGSFVCRAQVMNVESDGVGRSKRDAKHLAASNLIKKLRVSFPEIDDVRPIHQVEIPTMDMIVKLRDYCVQKQHPLPVFEIIQQGGTPDAPEFIAMCSVASIRRYGVSDKKKDAKQFAASEILSVIYEDDKPLEHEMQVASIDSKTEDIEEERYLKFKTYRELKDSCSNDDPPGVLLCDRHNYFSNFHKHLIDSAKAILNSKEYDEYDYERQAKDLLYVLKITPRITKHDSECTTEPMVHIEMNCSYDVLIANVAGKVYKSVIDYFRDMLD